MKRMRVVDPSAEDEPTPLRDGADGTARLALLCAGVAVALLTAVPAAATSRLLLAGDSITFGIVSDPQGPAFAEILPDLFAGEFDVVNAGLSGLSSVYLNPNVSCDVLCGSDTFFDDLIAPELPAEVATLMLGVNDALSFFLPEPTPPSDYEANMREIVDSIFDGGVSHIVLMSPPIPADIAHLADDYLIPYRDAVWSICKGTVGVLCGPDLQVLLDPDLDFAPGDVHPNAFGHEKIAYAVFEKVRAIPEPATGLLVLLGLLGLASSRRRATAQGQARART